MKNITHLIEKIEQSDLPDAEKKAVVDLIKNSKGDWGKFIISFLKIVRISEKVFELFGFDAGHFLDKFL